jgi:hypothetical protein
VAGVRSASPVDVHGCVVAGSPGAGVTQQGFCSDLFAGTRLLRAVWWVRTVAGGPDRHTTRAQIGIQRAGDVQLVGDVLASTDLPDTAFRLRTRRFTCGAGFGGSQTPSARADNPAWVRSRMTSRSNSARTQID